MLCNALRPRAGLTRRHSSGCRTPDPAGKAWSGDKRVDRTGMIAGAAPVGGAVHLHACRRVQEAVRTSRMWTSTAPVPVVMITRVLTLQAPLQQLSPPSQVVPLHMGQVIVVLMRNVGQIQPVHERIHTLRAAQHTLFSIAGQHWSTVPAGLRFCVRIVMQAQASPGAAVLGICQEGLHTMAGMAGVRGSGATERERRERERDAADAAGAVCSAGRSTHAYQHGSDLTLRSAMPY